MNDKKQTIQKRPRTLTRVAIVQALFQWEQGGEKTANLLIEQFLLYRASSDCTEESYNDGKTRIPDVRLFQSCIEGFIKLHTEIEGLLQKALPDEWPLHRLDPVIKAILRAAVTEFLLDKKEPPKNVIINEYIDVTHVFHDGEESILVNGVLNTLGKQLRHVPETVKT